MSEAGSEDPEHSVRAQSREDISPTNWNNRLPPAGLRPSNDQSAAPDSGHKSPAKIIPIAAKAHLPSTAQAGPVTFNQSELRVIFGLYGRKVASGEWRDYALDFLRDQAIFSVFRRSSEVPLYRIEKTPRLARKQGEYAAVAASGLILKRGSDLARVLAVLDRPLKIVR